MSSIKLDEDSSKKDFCSNSVKSGTSSSDFSEENYRQVFHDILIRGVPLDLADEAVEGELRKRREVKTAFRVKNRSDDNPTTTYRLRLKSAEAKNNFLQNGIQIKGKQYRCEKFHHARIIRCYRCQQFGHALEDCTSPTPICAKCSGKHRANDCRESIPRCVNCSGDHAAFDKDCPAWVSYVEGRNVITQWPPAVLHSSPLLPHPKSELRDIPEFRPRQEYRPQKEWRIKEKPPPAPVIVNAQAITRHELDEAVDHIKEHITEELVALKTNLTNILNETLDQIRVEVFANNHSHTGPTYSNDSGHGTQPYNSPQSSLAYSDISHTSTVAPSMTSPASGGPNPQVQHGCTFYSYRPDGPQMSYMNGPPTLEVPQHNMPMTDYQQEPHYNNYYPQQNNRCGGMGYHMPPPHNNHDRRIELDDIRSEILKVMNEAFLDKMRFGSK